MRNALNLSMSFLKVSVDTGMPLMSSSPKSKNFATFTVNCIVYGVVFLEVQRKDLKCFNLAMDRVARSVMPETLSRSKYLKFGNNNASW